MTIKPWREVAHPHKDVLEGKVKQSEFAADISQVHAGTAPEEYQDAEKFFAKYDQQQKKVEEAREQLRGAVAELERSVQKKSDDIPRKSETVFEKQTALNSAIIEKIRAMKSMLSDEQYGKLVVFEHNFPLQLQKMLMKRAKKQMNDADEE